MFCPHCGEEGIGAEMRFCPSCGAPLSSARPDTAGNVVGDGSERALTMFIGRSAMQWVSANKGRLLVYGVGMTLAAIVLAVVIVTIVSVIVGVTVALAPFIILIAALSLASRRRGTRHWRRYSREWTRHSRHWTRY